MVYTYVDPRGRASGNVGWDMDHAGQQSLLGGRALHARATGAPARRRDDDNEFGKAGRRGIPWTFVCVGIGVLAIIGLSVALIVRETQPEPAPSIVFAKTPPSPPPPAPLP
ncbi:MAG: hypothetical protein ACKVI4_17410, partial [Actinomycetales bacterium]